MAKRVLFFCSYIDLRRVTHILEVPHTQQDKNRATFRVACQGRTYNIQAETEDEMKRFENASVIKWVLLLLAKGLLYSRICSTNSMLPFRWVKAIQSLVKACRPTSGATP